MIRRLVSVSQPFRKKKTILYIEPRPTILNSISTKWSAENSPLMVLILQPLTHEIKRINRKIWLPFLRNFPYKLSRLLRIFHHRSSFYSIDINYKLFPFSSLEDPIRQDERSAVYKLQYQADYSKIENKNTVSTAKLRWKMSLEDLISQLTS